jgi:hypothetical protein
MASDSIDNSDDMRVRCYVLRGRVDRYLARKERQPWIGVSAPRRIFAVSTARMR